MKKIKKLAKTGMAKRLLAKAVLVAVLLTGLALPSTAIAQEDAGVALFDAAPAATVETPAPAPAVEVEAPAAPELVVADAPAAPQTSLDKLSSEIMNILIPVFSALMLGLSTLLLNWLRKKFKLDVSDKQIAQWSHVAELGANRGAEWARNKIKTLAEGEKLPGPDVLEVAVNWALDYGISHGLPEMGREKLAGLIESKLNLKREAAGES
jgi:hypothetical protein